MSWFTDIRDTFQSAASVAGNYFLPGSGLVTSQLVSKGAQDQLHSPLGQLAMIGSGVGGGLNNQFANYGTLGDAISTGGIGGVGDWASNLWSGGDVAGGMGGTSNMFNSSDMFNAPGMTSGNNPLDPDYLKKLQMMGGIPGVGGGVTPLPPGGFAGAGVSGVSIPSMAGGGGATPGFNPLSSAKDLNTLTSIGSGLYGLMNASSMRGMAKDAMNRADPWGASGGRAGADAQLQALLRDPSGAAQNDPAYKLRVQAAMRANAPMGTDSGAMASAAANASTDWYNNRLSQLGGISGANVNPGQGQQLGLEGTGMANTLAGNSLASMGFGLNTAMNGGIPQQMLEFLRSKGYTGS